MDVLNSFGLPVHFRILFALARGPLSIYPPPSERLQEDLEHTTVDSISIVYKSSRNLALSHSQSLNPDHSIGSLET